jgi:hypothetical protein
MFALLVLGLITVVIGLGLAIFGIKLVFFLSAVAAFLLLWWGIDRLLTPTIQSTEPMTYYICLGCGALGNSSGNYIRPCDWCLTPYFEGTSNPSYGKGCMRKITKEQYDTIKESPDRLQAAQQLGIK